MDRGQLTYCSVCGAAQIFVSEELQEQAAEASRHHSEHVATAAPINDIDEAATGMTPLGHLRRGATNEAQAWPTAVSYALLSGALTLALSVGAVVFAPLLFVVWLWILSAPTLAVSFYSARAPAKVPAGFAARLGLLTGLLVLLGSAVVSTLGLALTRAAHHGQALDTQLALAFAQVKATTAAQYGTAAAPVLHMLAVPEFRVGLLLWMIGVASALYLLLAAMTAGLTGLLLGRRRPA